MLVRSLLAAILLTTLISCNSKTEEPKPAATATLTPKKAPADESRRFPADGQTGTEIVKDHLLGKTFMPGGTLAHYKRAKQEYDMFVGQVATPTDAAIALSDWRKALTDAKLVPSFGGYFGDDGGSPVFVFTKNNRIAGIKGLPLKDADTQARILAGRLP